MNDAAMALENMPGTFPPRLDILPSPQRALWDELGTVAAPYMRRRNADDRAP